MLIIYELLTLSSVQRIARPLTLIDEEPQSRKQSPVVRVEKMFEQIQAKLKLLKDSANFILCVLPERKTSNIYGIALLFIGCMPTISCSDHILGLCSSTLIV